MSKSNKTKVKSSLKGARKIHNYKELEEEFKKNPVAKALYLAFKGAVAEENIAYIKKTPLKQLKK